MSHKKEPQRTPPLNTLDLNGIKAGARKTGFDLEYRVATQLRAAGWKVITGKYYLDDHSEQAREIDIVAYRVTPLEDFVCYTALIVSCKKLESNAWVMMARTIEQEPNDSDWRPFHGWTNNKTMNHLMGSKRFASDYYEKAIAAGAAKALEKPRVDIFAFQEMSLSGKPMNDKNIFDSLSSLMKAQAHELVSLPHRKKDRQVVYQFNLMSVVDAPLVCLEYGGEESVPIEVADEHHIARFIVQKRDVFARIRIVRATALEDVLDDYRALHEANVETFSQMHSDFFSDAANDFTKLNLLKDEFVKELRTHLTFAVRQRLGLKSIKTLDFEGIRTDPPCLTMNLELDDDELRIIRTDQAAMNAFRIALKRVYRYEGDFELV